MSTRITKSFRDSMGWLHTWLGLGLSAVLFAVFWTGTLTVFDREIDQWMIPELRFPASETVSIDETVLPRLDDINPAVGSEFWVAPPRDRIPAIRLYYEDQNGHTREDFLDPQTGATLDLTDSHAGSEFFFHFHYMLHMPGIIGYLVVGIAAMGMLILIISGLFIHRKIFQEFFTFRPKTRTRRASLDFHNLTAMVGLPLHFLLPLSGLVIFATVYFPWPISVPYEGNLRAYNAQIEGYAQHHIDLADRPGGPVTSLDRFYNRAEEIWRAEEGSATSEPEWMGIFNYGDANTYVFAERYFPSRRVAIGPDQISFDPQTGEVLNRFSPEPIHHAMNWLEGLHWIQFDHWPLRWLYFFGGLTGCAMIGSGLIFWMHSRIRKGMSDPFSIRFIRALSVSAICGVILASAAFMISNRLIPKSISLDVHRHDLEIWAFFAAWIVSTLHACLRGKAAWHEQSFAIGVLALIAVGLNWLTTGDHLITSMTSGLWAVAGVDLMLILTSFLAGYFALRLSKAFATSASPDASGAASALPDRPAEQN